MLGLRRELGTSGYTEPSVSVVWAMRPFCQVLVPLQCLFQFLDNMPMFMWDLTSGEVNTSTQESQVTPPFNLGCLLLLARLFLFVLSFGCDACEVGIALSLVCLVREGRPVCQVCSLLNFSFCQLGPSPQAEEAGVK